MLKIHALVRNMQAYIGWYLEMSTHGIHATLDQLSDTVLDAKIRYQKGKEKRRKKKKIRKEKTEREIKTQQAQCCIINGPLHQVLISQKRIFCLYIYKTCKTI